jgi:tRNA pseudouridine55 synthase
MAKKRRGIPIHGWLNIDKPAGMSSAQVVGAVKRITNAQKAGHAGTLDPFATGILPVALGEATKTVSYIVSDVKDYKFTARWGQSTNTDDIDGEIMNESDSRPDIKSIQNCLSEFIGAIWQRPPPYSAIKIDGKRAYKLARDGKDVEIPAREVVIHDLKLVQVVDADHAIFEVTCGKGTYIRSLARDLGMKMGTFAHLTELRRTRVGPFFENDAISLDKLEKLWQCPAEFEALLPITTALDDIPAVAITETQALRFRHGNDVATPDLADGIVCAMDGNSPIGIARVEDERLFPIRVFNI